MKPKFWKDLLTDEPFTRKDLITIQDPNSLEKFNLSTFFHLKKNLKVLDEGEGGSGLGVIRRGMEYVDLMFLDFLTSKKASETSELDSFGNTEVKCCIRYGDLESTVYFVWSLIALCVIVC